MSKKQVKNKSFFNNLRDIISKNKNSIIFKLMIIIFILFFIINLIFLYYININVQFICKKNDEFKNDTEVTGKIEYFNKMSFQENDLLCMSADGELKIIEKNENQGESLNKSDDKEIVEFREKIIEEIIEEIKDKEKDGIIKEEQEDRVEENREDEEVMIKTSPLGCATNLQRNGIHCMAFEKKHWCGNNGNNCVPWYTAPAKPFTPEIGTYIFDCNSCQWNLSCPENYIEHEGRCVYVSG
ncbi:MAG TPA: hypothetical protein VJ926_02445 [Patescibacteria group bacterium]|nr:hypothetical protein [Patescibacteria group bacterium]